MQGGSQLTGSVPNLPTQPGPPADMSVVCSIRDDIVAADVLLALTVEICRTGHPKTTPLLCQVMKRYLCCKK